MLLLERMQLRESVTDGEPLRVAGVDAADEGIDGVVEEFLPEPAANEVGHAFESVRRGR
jgi:hypothetical protein